MYTHPEWKDEPLEGLLTEEEFEELYEPCDPRKPISLWILATALGFISLVVAIPIVVIFL